MFTKFVRGRLNSAGDRRARLYGGGKIYSHIELSRSKLHKKDDLQVGNWHVNCQHSSLTIFLEVLYITARWLLIANKERAVFTHVIIIRPHRLNAVQWCGLLLQML